MPRKHLLFPVEPTRLLTLLCLGVLLYFSLGCAVGVSGPMSSSLQKEQAALSTGTIAPSFFGMVVKTPGAQAAVTVGSLRLWDSGVTWASLEPARGSFQWSTLDREVASAEAAGQQITLTLGMTPTWASSQPALSSAYGDGATAKPTQLADWDDYVQAVASRYKGRIGAYEVWNAPEDSRYWTGPISTMGSDMATLAARTRQDVQAADPSALIVSPAMSSDGLQTFLTAGGGASIDAVASALNLGGDGSPEAMADTIHRLRAAMAGTAADGKPLWNDQSSWALPSGGLSPEEQASWVARALLLNAGFAVQRLNWYAWDDAGAGIVALSDQSGHATQAAQAYAAVAGWLEGAQMNGCAATAGGLWTCQLVRSGQPAWVLWSTNGTVHSSSFGATTVVDLAGDTTQVAADSKVSVGASPVLLQ